MNQAENILHELKENGHRLTRVRKALIEALCEAKSPLSAAELGELLETNKVGANKTTIYREVDFLVQKEIAREIDLLDGRKRYEIFREGSHHHLVCTKCHDIKCVEMEADLMRLGSTIHAEHNFKVENQVLEFFGVCEECSQE